MVVCATCGAAAISAGGVCRVCGTLSKDFRREETEAAEFGRIRTVKAPKGKQQHRPALEALAQRSVRAVQMCIVILLRHQVKAMAKYLSMDPQDLEDIVRRLWQRMLHCMITGQNPFVPIQDRALKLNTGITCTPVILGIASRLLHLPLDPGLLSYLCYDGTIPYHQVESLFPQELTKWVAHKSKIRAPHRENPLRLARSVELWGRFLYGKPLPKPNYCGIAHMMIKELQLPIQLGRACTKLMTDVGMPNPHPLIATGPAQRTRNQHMKRNRYPPGAHVASFIIILVKCIYGCDDEREYLRGIGLPRGFFVLSGGALGRVLHAPFGNLIPNNTAHATQGGTHRGHRKRTSAAAQQQRQRPADEEEGVNTPLLFDDDDDDDDGSDGGDDGGIASGLNADDDRGGGDEDNGGGEEDRRESGEAAARVNTAGKGGGRRTRKGNKRRARRCPPKPREYPGNVMAWVEWRARVQYVLFGEPEAMLMQAKVSDAHDSAVQSVSKLSSFLEPLSHNFERPNRDAVEPDLHYTTLFPHAVRFAAYHNNPTEHRGDLHFSESYMFLLRVLEFFTGVAPRLQDFEHQRLLRRVLHQYGLPVICEE